MPTKVQILNMALIHLGRDPTLSDADTAFRQSPTAAKLAAAWNIVLPDAIAKHPWNFAMRRDQLGAEDVPPKFGWSYRYQLPTEPRCLRMWEIDPATHGLGQPWKREGAFLLCNVAGPLNIRYIAAIFDPNEFDAGFTAVLSLELAANCAFAVAGIDGKPFMDVADAKRREARTDNGQESEEPPYDDPGDWLEHRYREL